MFAATSFGEAKQRPGATQATKKRRRRRPRRSLTSVAEVERQRQRWRRKSANHLALLKEGVASLLAEKDISRRDQGLLHFEEYLAEYTSDGNLGRIPPGECRHGSFPS